MSEKTNRRKGVIAVIFHFGCHISHWTAIRVHSTAQSDIRKHTLFCCSSEVVLRLSATARSQDMALNWLAFSGECLSSARVCSQRERPAKTGPVTRLSIKRPSESTSQSCLSCHLDLMSLTTGSPLICTNSRSDGTSDARQHLKGSARTTARTPANTSVALNLSPINLLVFWNQCSRVRTQTSTNRCTHINTGRQVLAKQRAPAIGSSINFFGIDSTWNIKSILIQIQPATGTQPPGIWCTRLWVLSLAIMEFSRSAKNNKEWHSKWSLLALIMSLYEIIKLLITVWVNSNLNSIISFES